jgi:hypothetical protein
VVKVVTLRQPATASLQGARAPSAGRMVIERVRTVLLPLLQRRISR